VLVPDVLGALTVLCETNPREKKGFAAESEQKQEPNNEKLDSVKTFELNTCELGVFRF